MSSRISRYNNDSDEMTNRHSRVARNRKLYQDLGRNEKYTSFGNVGKLEAVELDQAKRNIETRRGYQVMREYNFLDDKPNTPRHVLEEFNSIYQFNQEKSHDLNTILKEARELREKDDLERKRKLHNESYNILESGPENIAKLKSEVHKTIKPVENEEELEELINTITSKELRNKIDQEQEKSLLSDLMATSSLEEVVEPIASSTSKEEPKPVENKPKENELDQSFFTKSLDLSEEDFIDDEEEELKKQSVFLTILKIILSILLIAAVGFGVYYVINNF